MSSSTNQSMHADHTHVFVGGLHRSGTSLLFQCLRQHPLVSAFQDTGVPEDEGQHLQTVYRPASKLGGPGRFGFSPHVHLTEDSKLVSEANRLKLLDQWRPHWDMSKKVLLEKTPQNLVQTRFLQAMFPEARFVIVQRHPIAVSLATRRWSRTSLYSLIEHWLRCHEVFEADRPHLDRVLVVTYEELVRRPEATLRQVFDFLSVDPLPPSLQVKNANEKYDRAWNAARTGILSRHYIHRLCGRFERRVRRFGYSLQETSGVEMDVIADDSLELEHGRFGVRDAALTSLYRCAGQFRRLSYRAYRRSRRTIRTISGRERTRRPAVDTNPLANVARGASTTDASV